LDRSAGLELTTIDEGIENLPAPRWACPSFLWREVVVLRFDHRQRSRLREREPSDEDKGEKM
jgi:hypothetical protein